MTVDGVAIAIGGTSLAYPLLPHTRWLLTAILEEELRGREKYYNCNPTRHTHVRAHNVHESQNSNGNVHVLYMYSGTL